MIGSELLTRIGLRSAAPVGPDMSLIRVKVHTLVPTKLTIQI